MNDDTYSFKYMFLSSRGQYEKDYVKEKKFSAIDIEESILKRLEEKYGEALNIDLIPKNARIYLFNASFKSNEDLFKYISNAYKEKHPNFKNGYDKIALIAEGHNADGFGFLYWKNTKKKAEGQEKYTYERLVPIVYRTDCHDIETSVKYIDLCYPKKLVIKIINDKLEHTDIKFNRDLISAIKDLLKAKHNSGCDALDDVLKKIHHVREYKEDEDVSIETLLNGYILNKNNYSPVYYDLLSLIMYYERTNKIVNTFNQTYDLSEGTIDGKDMSVLTISFLSILSAPEYINNKYKSIEILESQRVQERQDLYEEIAKQVINEYNESHFTDVTIDDVNFFEGEYQEIIEETNKRFQEQTNGHQRK